MNVAKLVTEVLHRHRAVTDVALVGSRARGDATALSDWDFRIDGDDMAELVAALPDISTELRPLASLWDPLSERAVYMLVLDGPVKVDLFPGEQRRPLEAPRIPNAKNLALIDAHFWDWTLWLGSKAIRHDDAMVARELAKMYAHILQPIGAPHAPSSIQEAVNTYTDVRSEAESACGVRVSRDLANQVVGALARHGIVRYS
jgi:hypothetical protein